MAEKRYYWLKLKEGFFDEKEIKKLRKIAGGDTYTIIYLKLLLISLKDKGKLYFDGVEETFIEELALALDEDVENVKVTVSYLISVGLLKEVTSVEAEMTRMPEMIGSESASAERVRKHRQRQKILEDTEEQKMLPEDTEEESLHCNGDVTDCNTDIDTEKETELYTETKKKKEPSSFDEEFDALWELYPNKKGKNDAKKHYIAARKKGVTYEEVEQGIIAYSKYIHVTRSEKYCKYGSTFFSQKAWEDDWSTDSQQTFDNQYPQKPKEKTQEEIEDLDAFLAELRKREREELREELDKRRKRP